MSKLQARREPFDPALEGEVAQPRNGLIYTTFAASINFFRPYAPQIVPIIVCAFFIPVTLALSGFAGWVVWNSLSTGWEVPLYLQYGEGVAPYAVSLIPSLHPSQRYDVSLHLKVPACESNLALGNFMANLALATTSNKTLATVRRPAVVIAHTSWWLIRTPKIISIDVPMFSSFIAGTSNVVADVQVGRADNWRTIGDGTGRELSVVSASLRGLVVPHGIRGLAIRFPLLSSLAASLIFLVVSTLILGMFILPLMLPSGLDDVEDTRKPTSVSSIPFPPPERPRRKRRSQLRRSTSDTTNPSSSVSTMSDINPLHPSEALIKQTNRELYKMVKIEGSISNMPSAENEGAEKPLRQRRISTKRESDGESS